MRPVSDLTGITPEQLRAYLTEWNGSRRLLRSGSGCRPGRELSAATDLVSALTFKVAAREKPAASPAYMH